MPINSLSQLSVFPAKWKIYLRVEGEEIVKQIIIIIIIMIIKCNKP